MASDLAAIDRLARLQIRLGLYCFADRATDLVRFGRELTSLEGSVQPTKHELARRVRMLRVELSGLLEDIHKLER